MKLGNPETKRSPRDLPKNHSAGVAMITSYLIADNAQGKIPLRQVLWMCCDWLLGNIPLWHRVWSWNSTYLQSSCRGMINEKQTKKQQTPKIPQVKIVLQLKLDFILKQSDISQILKINKNNSNCNWFIFRALLLSRLTFLFLFLMYQQAQKIRYVRFVWYSFWSSVFC